MTKLSWWRRMIGRWAAGTRRAAFAASNVNERNVTAGVDWTALYRDRYNYDRDQVLEQALLAWRLNPLARRIIDLQDQYILDGIDFDCDDAPTLAFLREFWNHP